ncbi:MAG: 5-(carboxyamino)imidazole ribonucleotide mutase [Phycisphaerales bacterium]|nr:5-(carboxyamino)imidazole ribonucleotide mutase [Phycisphaerales bacterium]MBT7170230.1 5-(carboxyamino)imidazole ribonucleotide mutase [Phycisphaerales bacterium]
MTEAATVGVVMGSDSDLDTMKKCLALLQELGLGYEVRILSAHRTPNEAHEFAATARDRGLKVLIAAAGMSAALSGVLSAATTLPVIGVPMVSGPLGGMDAVLSTLQMPPGIPVGAMAIGSAGAKNAAIFAAEIIGVCDAAMADRLAKYKADMASTVLAKDAKLQTEV